MVEYKIIKKEINKSFSIRINCNPQSDSYSNYAMVVINAFGNMFTYLFVLTNIINVVCGRQSKTRLLCLIQPHKYTLTI